MSKITANEITDEVGTGSPSFPNGLGWVELNDPGFVEEKEQSAIQKLQAKLDEPVRSSVSVL